MRYRKPHRPCYWRSNDIRCRAEAKYYHSNKFQTKEIYEWFCPIHKCKLCREGV